MDKRHRGMTFKNLSVGDVFEFDEDFMRRLASGSPLGPWKKVAARKYESHPKVNGITHTIGTVNVAVKRVDVKV